MSSPPQPPLIPSQPSSEGGRPGDEGSTGVRKFAIQNHRRPVSPCDCTRAYPLLPFLKPTDPDMKTQENTFQILKIYNVVLYDELRSLEIQNIVRDCFAVKMIDRVRTIHRTPVEPCTVTPLDARPKSIVSEKCLLKFFFNR